MLWNITVINPYQSVAETADVNVDINEDVSSDMLIYGDAKKLADESIELTPLETWKSGSAWYTNQILTNNGFVAEFKYWAGGGRGDRLGGADGIVLTLSEKPGLGGEGEYLGFVGNNAFGVELDSYAGNRNDPAGKHVAIIHTEHRIIYAQH